MSDRVLWTCANRDCLHVYRSEKPVKCPECGYNTVFRGVYNKETQEVKEDK